MLNLRNTCKHEGIMSICLLPVHTCEDTIKVKSMHLCSNVFVYSLNLDSRLCRSGVRCILPYQPTHWAAFWEVVGLLVSTSLPWGQKNADTINSNWDTNMQVFFCFILFSIEEDFTCVSLNWAVSSCYRIVRWSLPIYGKKLWVK